MDEMVPMSVSETIILLTSSMYPELVHSQDSVSRQEHPMDMFSRAMHQEMLLGKQHLVDDGDSLEMPEPTLVPTSSEPPMIWMWFSRETMYEQDGLMRVNIIPLGEKALFNPTPPME